MTEPGPNVAQHLPVSVVIVDDHLLLADSVAAALAAAGDITVTAIVGTGAEALKAVREHQPAVCLLDQRLPDGLGTDLLPALLQASPDTRVVMVTGGDSHEVLHRAVEAGCVGFLSKGERASALIDAVRQAAAGEAVFTAADLRRLMPQLSRPSRRLGDDLTPRELDVLRLLALGYTTNAVAAELFISVPTTRNHIQALLTKLDAHSKLEAVTIALREQLVPPP